MIGSLLVWGNDTSYSVWCLIGPYILIYFYRGLLHLCHGLAQYCSTSVISPPNLFHFTFNRDIILVLLLSLQSEMWHTRIQVSCILRILCPLYNYTRCFSSNQVDFLQCIGGLGLRSQYGDLLRIQAVHDRITLGARFSLAVQPVVDHIRAKWKMMVVRAGTFFNKYYERIHPIVRKLIYFYSKSNEMHHILKFILFCSSNSTCFRRSFRLSSGVYGSIYQVSPYSRTAYVIQIMKSRPEWDWWCM
jgi:hypothetical protein